MALSEDDEVVSSITLADHVRTYEHLADEAAGLQAAARPS